MDAIIKETQTIFKRQKTRQLLMVDMMELKPLLGQWDAVVHGPTSECRIMLPQDPDWSSLFLASGKGQ